MKSSKSSYTWMYLKKSSCITQVVQICRVFVPTVNALRPPYYILLVFSSLLTVSPTSFFSTRLLVTPVASLWFLPLLLLVGSQWHFFLFPASYSCFRFFSPLFGLPIQDPLCNSEICKSKTWLCYLLPAWREWRSCYPAVLFLFVVPVLLKMFIMFLGTFFGQINILLFFSAHFFLAFQHPEASWCWQQGDQLEMPLLSM